MRPDRVDTVSSWCTAALPTSSVSTLDAARLPIKHVVKRQSAQKLGVALETYCLRATCDSPSPMPLTTLDTELWNTNDSATVFCLGKSGCALKLIADPALYIFGVALSTCFVTVIELWSTRAVLPAWATVNVEQIKVPIAARVTARNADRIGSPVQGMRCHNGGAAMSHVPIRKGSNTSVPVLHLALA